MVPVVVTQAKVVLFAKEVTVQVVPFVHASVLPLVLSPQHVSSHLPDEPHTPERQSDARLQLAPGAFVPIDVRPTADPGMQ